MGISLNVMNLHSPRAIRQHVLGIDDNNVGFLLGASLAVWAQLTRCLEGLLIERLIAAWVTIVAPSAT